MRFRRRAGVENFGDQLAAGTKEKAARDLQLTSGPIKFLTVKLGWKARVNGKIGCLPGSIYADDGPMLLRIYTD